MALEDGCDSERVWHGSINIPYHILYVNTQEFIVIAELLLITYNLVVSFRKYRFPPMIINYRANCLLKRILFSLIQCPLHLICYRSV